MHQEILFGSLKKIEPGKAVLCLTDGALYVILILPKVWILLSLC